MIQGLNDSQHKQAYRLNAIYNHTCTLDGLTIFGQRMTLSDAQRQVAYNILMLKNVLEAAV